MALIQSASELVRYVRLQTSQTYNLEVNQSSDLVISLTTTPDRIGLLQKTLRSLIDQSLLPKKIFLFLPKLFRGETAYEVPSEILSFPLVEIIEVEKDYGPATKWYYALSQNVRRADSVVVLDDDQIYPYRLIEHYDKLSKDQPQDAHTLCGWDIPEQFNHNNREPIFSGKVHLFSSKGVTSVPRQVDCLQGASSFMVPASKMSSEILKGVEDMGEYLFADDILLSGLLARSNVKIFVSPANFTYIRMHNFKTGPQPSLLHSKNKDNRLNNHLYGHFKDIWSSLDQRVR